jgi:hypothetical protein
MPGYNHYDWCMCGWCYKTGINGYSRRKDDLDEIDYRAAERTVAQSGANRSYAACFVIPNAKCRCCGASVFYYENEHGSKVFFDELGWPWPKHSCPGNPYTSGFDASSKVPRTRTLESVLQIAKAARQIDFDPASKFRFAFGDSPWDLLSVIEVIRCGFENFIKARSISPYLDEAVFVAFVSAKLLPAIGDYFGFNGHEISPLDTVSLEPKRLKARLLTAAEFPISERGSAA